MAKIPTEEKERIIEAASDMDQMKADIKVIIEAMAELVKAVDNGKKEEEKEGDKDSEGVQGI